MDYDKTYVFVASTELDGRTKWLELMSGEWVPVGHLAEATTYPIVSDLRADLAKDGIDDYEIHPVKLELME